MLTPREAAALLLPTVSSGLVDRLLAGAGLRDAALAESGAGFDKNHYSAEAGRQFGTVRAALFHYLTVGEARGLSPNAQFNPRRYLRRNPDLASLGYRPYGHYLSFGRYEGRSETANASLAEFDFAAVLDQPPPAGMPDVSIVVPVYGNRDLSLRAIGSVLASRPTTPYELVVVDDDSPDRLLKAELAELARRGLAKLIVNDRNRGFVASANAGLQASLGRDVVLLNSDTLVHGDWLDRLLSGLRSRRSIATATPLSNAATIVSYPIFLGASRWPAPSASGAVDDACRALAMPPVQIPTAVGFCMAVAAACVRQIGGFDEASFGRGYGEENDFSLRATKAGWSHVAVPGVFVWHHGGGSFGRDREALIAAAQEKLEELHPGYASSVRQFIAEDPLRQTRGALDIARIRRAPVRKVLGLQAFASDDEPVLPLVLRPDLPPFAGFFRVVGTPQMPVPNVPRIPGASAVADLAKLIKEMDIGEARMHFSERSVSPAARALELAAKRAGVELRFLN